MACYLLALSANGKRAARKTAAGTRVREQTGPSVLVEQKKLRAATRSIQLHFATEEENELSCERHCCFILPSETIEAKKMTLQDTVDSNVATSVRTLRNEANALLLRITATTATMDDAGRWRHSAMT